MNGYPFSHFCTCPECFGELIEKENTLICTGCAKTYLILNGIPILLPRYEDELRVLYTQNYEKMAGDDLNEPLETLREYRHAIIYDFVGNTKGKRALDIGSSHALYLRKLDLDFKVAFDLSLTYLRAIPACERIVRICGDAEKLPFKKGVFDIIIICDILEHMLEPKNLIQRLRTICNSDTRIIVHIPWEENLEAYRNSSYQFTHLRSFNAFTFADLWRDFYIKRVRKTYPNMKYPLLFGLDDRLPLFLYNRLVKRYFFEKNAAKKDFDWRTARSNRLPEGERWLLWFFRPVFKIFEMRLRS